MNIIWEDFDKWFNSQTQFNPVIHDDIVLKGVCWQAWLAVTNKYLGPEKHHAHKNPELIIERIKSIKFTDLPKFSSIKNREGFLFNGEEPIFG